MLKLLSKENQLVFDGILASIQKKVKESLAKTGGSVVLMIRMRTEKGKDVNGQKFKPYSKQYTEFRKLTGRKINPVNLTFTGKMLGSMIPIVSDNSVVVKFSRDSEEKKAAAHNFGAKRKSRALGVFRHA